MAMFEGCDILAIDVSDLSYVEFETREVVRADVPRVPKFNAALV